MTTFHQLQEVIISTFFYHCKQARQTLKHKFTSLQTDIATLNDDCIYAILEWLSLDDVCLFSRTSKHFQILCENHFRRKYLNEISSDVEVRIERDGKLHVESYVKYYHNFIKTLHIYVKYKYRNKKVQFSSVSSLINFITTKCDDKLNIISIDGDIELVRLSKEVETFLRNVEIVKFRSRSAGRQDEAIFLKCCPKLVKLILCGKIQQCSIDAILQQQYPQLTRFEHSGIFVLSFCAADTLKTFFQNHDKIEFVHLEFHFCAGAKRRNYRAFEYIKALDYVPNLKQLCLFVDGSVKNCFPAICSHLNILYERGIGRSLEMDFDLDDGAQLLIEHRTHLATLKHITKIDLTLVKLTHLLPALRSLVHLKILVLRCLLHEGNWNEWIHLDELIGEVESAQNLDLPQVEEVHIEQILDDKELTAYIMLFSRYWKNLKRLAVPLEENIEAMIADRNAYRLELLEEFGAMYLNLNPTPNTESNTKFDIPELNRARERLIGACELTIFTNYAGNETNLSHKLVKLKSVQFEHNKYADSLQEYYMK